MTTKGDRGGPDLLATVITGFQEMGVPERPAELDAMIAMAPPAKRADAPVTKGADHRRSWNWIASLPLPWRVAIGLLVAVGVLVTVIASSRHNLALAEVIAATNQHKLVRYTQKQLTEMNPQRVRKGAVLRGEGKQIVFADLDRPRYRTEFYYMTDGGEVVIYRVVDGTTGLGLTANAREKKASLYRLVGDEHLTGGKPAVPLLDSLRELQQNEKTTSEQAKFGKRKAVKYVLKEQQNTTTLWVDTETRLPVLMERGMLQPTPEISLNRWTMSDFEWDPHAGDPNQIFSTTPPPGYAVEDRTRDKQKLTPATKPDDKSDAPTGADIGRLRVAEQTVREAAELALPALVAVEQAADPGTFASGIVISADGLIVSQYHVSHMVDNLVTGEADVSRRPGERVKVVLHDGRMRTATVLGADRTFDLSLLRLVEPGPYAHAPLGGDDAAELGDRVLKIGHPGGYSRVRGPVVRLGRVLCRTRDSIVVDCLTDGGDSGGSLHGLDGRVIGVIRGSALSDALREQAGVAAIRYRSPFSAYTTATQVRDLLPSMLKGVLRDADETAGREVVNALRDAQRLSTDCWTQGAKVRAGYRRMVSGAKSGVARIRTGDKQVALGAVVSPDGWVLTTFGSLPSDPVCELADGRVLPALVRSVDPRWDIALLKVSADGLHPITWGDDPHIPVGTFVAAPGLQEEPLAVGVISTGSGQNGVMEEGEGDGRSLEVIGHDMPLLDSECGGPVLDLSGKAVGITLTRAPHGCNALPAATVARLLVSLRAK